MGFAPIPRLSQSRMLTVTLWPHSDRLDASAECSNFVMVSGGGNYKLAWRKRSEGNRTRRTLLCRQASSLALVRGMKMVLLPGIAPRSSAYQADALLLSYRRMRI